MKRAHLNKLLEARNAQRAAILATHLESGASALFLPDEDAILDLLDHDLSEQALAALHTDRAQIIDTPSGEVFLNVFNAPLRMVIVGAVHIAQALAPMAQAAGFAVSIIDPRGAFADAERFAGTVVIEDWPDDALKATPPDARTAVITLTHDPKLDDAALIVALGSPAFYIGSLGSRKTHAARLERLKLQNLSEDELARINGPVGLNIGAQSAAEIAVSILAQVIETLRQRAA